MPTTSMNIRMDSDVKQEAQQLFAEFGLDMTTAINLFLRQSIRERSIPFAVRLVSNEPNAASVAAMDEGDAIIRTGRKRFSSAEEMFSDLGI